MVSTPGTFPILPLPMLSGKFRLSFRHLQVRYCLLLLPLFTRSRCRCSPPLPSRVSPPLIRPFGAFLDRSELQGSRSSPVICRSWSCGSCCSPYASCHFAHKCRLCHGPHRTKDFPSPQPNTSQHEDKEPPHSSPPHGSSSSSKCHRLGISRFCRLTAPLLLVPLHSVPG